MSKQYIPYKDFIHEGEYLSAGEQIHINHADCPDGEDTRQRLYIKRTEDGGTLLAYCHNCGLSGSYREAKLGYVPSKTSGTYTSTREESESAGRKTYYGSNISSDFESKLSEWGSSTARSWITKYGITSLEITHYRVGYSESRDSILLPIYNEGGKLLGVQHRTFTEGHPKYVTKSKTKPIWWYSGDNVALQSSAATPICIVEDIVSGIKCSRYTPTIALLGASMSDELAAFIVNKSTNFIVFLDDDNRQVKLNQLKIKDKFEQMGYTVKLITGIDKDPKECSSGELERLLL